MSFCVVGAGAEVGDGEANLFDAKAGASTEPGFLPLLSADGCDRNTENCQSDEPIQVFELPEHLHLLFS
jgi:hypothetical protein